ncbi:tRNA (adenosine(37)-N6)-threonylcarbamoyltransferase complex ATPase subunit type 1 TsaE [Wohlfahrtiimonas populi]|uniref:tRNA (adenosine(37)-N6)-threonylcarbamoyltransferase complex ATPase subunit type 1 TsaE n=1 Tax=Wohlfahrtiimonas populi TaxID=1940240 RepID=UPI00098D0DBA|nr:tRNA (adenosine(37)-N6)-threonylcarbamoyltransferase complex ATPase subunit type 1 TsaE [Wohlfahrtiimonas populi]
MDLTIELHCESDTAAIAEKLAAVIASQNLQAFKLYLSGELGAGKTTFSKYFLKALGVEEIIKSPTYTIIESYVAGDFNIDHIDLYRIEEQDLYDLGFLEDDHKIWLIEWPEKGGESLPESDLLLVLERNESLSMQLLPKSESGQQAVLALDI